ncbi:MAG: type I DNA topoisomerase, partial [Chloroflexi bacterium]|nr:type I DNA topoisomerase [Chloroflexota bacterium]
MSKKLVIVESPAKARTVGRFLGGEYVVKASVGHIRDLPSNRMGVDVGDDFLPRYVIPEKKKKVVKELRADAKDAAQIFLATDPDREGEAISWHLKEALNSSIKNKPVHRVEFHEITREAIDHAFASPREINSRLVEAQQARRILDRLVGYSISPLLRRKMGKNGLSAGRVQSVAVRLVVERERAINAFEPQEYWSIQADLARAESRKAKKDIFRASLAQINGEKQWLKSGEDAQVHVAVLERATYTVTDVRKKEVQRNPAPPFITSTRQQEASRKLGFTAKRTMAVAQQLYEGLPIGPEGNVGLITYMRTDSTNVAEMAQREALAYIGERYGPSYVPPSPRQYKTKAKGAQEAHEAVRPTLAHREPAAIKEYLTSDQFKLYDLIWKRFIASQMASAVMDSTSVDIQALDKDKGTDYLFRATGSTVKFPGFTAVYTEGKDEVS